MAARAHKHFAPTLFKLRFRYEFYFWEIIIMLRKFLFVLILLLSSNRPFTTLSWCLAVNIVAVLLQYYYRPFNCFDCLLSRSRRCTHWGAMDQLELGLLLAQLCSLSLGLYLYNQGGSAKSGKRNTTKGGPSLKFDSLTPADIVMLITVVLAVSLAFLVIGYLYLKTYLLRNKMRNAADKNEYQTAQNMQAVNLNNASGFCGC